MEVSASRSEPICEGTTQPRPLERRLSVFLTWAILLLTSGYTSLAYWGYSKVEHEDPLSWQRLTSGHGVVPAQYRIGIYYSAHFLARLGHLQLRHVFAIADCFCLLASLAIGFFLLTRQPAFRHATVSRRWIQVLLGLLLVQIYLPWTLWFQEPETIPSLLILASSALLCSGFLRVPRFMLAGTLLLFALLGSTIRVDAVVAFHAGMLLACLVSPAASTPLGRGWQIITSLAAIAIAVGIAYYLAHFIFPHNVREVALLQFFDNLHSWSGAMVLLCALPPWVLTIRLAQRQWPQLNGWARGLVAGSLLECAMFLTFGMSEEVRIFLPFALTLLPLSATLLPAWLEGSTVNAG